MWNADIRAEWYMGRDERLTASAFYKKIDKFVRTNVIGIVPVMNKRGSVRQNYNVSNDFIIKQIHHTCVALDRENVCRNCAHPKWNSRCVRGHTTFFICSL